MRISDRLVICFFLIICDFSAFFVTYQLIDWLQVSFPMIGLRFLDTHNVWINTSIWFAVAFYLGVYQAYVNYSFDVMLRQTWRALIYQQVIVAILLFINTGSFYIEEVILVKIGLLFFFIFLMRYVFIWIDYRLENRSNHFNRIGIFGLNQTAIRLARAIEMKYHGNKFAGIINEADVLRFGYDQVNPTEQIINAMYYAKQDNIRELFICFPSHLIPDINFLFMEAEKSFIRLHIIPSALEHRDYPYSLNSAIGVRYFTNRKKPLDELINRFFKRVFDVVFSVLVILFILSWLYPLLAIIIKVQSKGPVLFKQKRTGRSNEVFWCYKFRSMYINNLQDEKQAVKEDNRLTPIGRFIRKTSIDEFPQFWNVLLGDMSVVGPRPHMLYHTKQYQQLAEGFAFRHFVKPGITGLAQVSGFRGEIKHVDILQARINKDIEYIESWGLIQDFKICFLTIYFLIVGDEHAY